MKNKIYNLTKNNSERKSLIVAIVALLFTIISVVGITYAAFRYTKEGSRSNKVTTSTITIIKISFNLLFSDFAI